MSETCVARLCSIAYCTMPSAARNPFIHCLVLAIRMGEDRADAQPCSGLSMCKSHCPILFLAVVYCIQYSAARKMVLTPNHRLRNNISLLQLSCHTIVAMSSIRDTEPRVILAVNSRSATSVMTCMHKIRKVGLPIQMHPPFIAALV